MRLVYRMRHVASLTSGVWFKHQGIPSRRNSHGGCILQSISIKTLSNRGGYGETVFGFAEDRKCSSVDDAGDGSHAGTCICRGGGALNAEVDSAVTATQGGQGDSSAAEDSSDAQTDSSDTQQGAAVIGADDSNGGEGLPEAGVVSASMEPDTTAKALDIDEAPMSDGASALSEGGASLTPGWTRSGTCEWKIDGDGLLTVRPLGGGGASGELADWEYNYNGALGIPRESPSSPLSSNQACPLGRAATCSATARRFPPWTCRAWTPPR